MSLNNRLRTWWGEGTASRKTEPSFVNAPSAGTTHDPAWTFWHEHLSHPDPHSSVRMWRTAPANASRPFVGLDQLTLEPVLTPPDSSLLYVGAPGCGKTSSGTAINFALAPGGALFWGTRSDGHLIASMMRLRGGDVWMIDATGHGLPGAKTYAFSIFDGLLVDGRPNYRRAKKRFDRIVRTPNLTQAGRRELGDQSFWPESASELGVCGALFCLKTNQTFDDFLSACARQDDTYMQAAANQLRSSTNRTYRNAGDWLEGFVRGAHGQKSGIYAHVTMALGFWLSEEGIRIEEQAAAARLELKDVAFGIPEAENDFVGDSLMLRAGNYARQRGRHPSFVIADAGNEDPARAYYLEAVSSLIDVIKDRAEANYRAGRPNGPAFYLCLDELFRAAIPGLVDNLADSRDRGYVVIGAVQDTSQLREVYQLQQIGDVIAKFATVVFLGPVPNIDDARDISDLMKRRVVDLHSAHQPMEGSASFGVSEQIYPELSADEIARGHDNPRMALQLVRGRSWNYVYMEPYFEGRWLSLWARTTIHSVETGIGLDFPLPPLTKDGLAAIDALGLGEAYRRAVEKHQANQQY